MNARDRASFAVFIVGMTVSCGLTFFGIHLVLTRVMGVSIAVSLFLVSSTILFTLPQVIVGMILYYKRKYSSRIPKPGEYLNKGKPKLIKLFLITQIMMIVGFFAQIQVFEGLKSDGNIAWMILCGVVGVLIPIWIAIRTRPLGEYFASKWGEREKSS